jgi:hypothetical protein
MPPEKQQVLVSVREVVAAMGGTTALAEWCGVTVSAVSNWAAEGWIPPARYLAISTELMRRGYRVAPSVFRQQVGIPIADHQRLTDR